MNTTYLDELKKEAGEIAHFICYGDVEPGATQLNALIDKVVLQTKEEMRSKIAAMMSASEYENQHDTTIDKVLEMLDTSTNNT